MEWLLKIVDGPVKGAEIALVSGFRVKVGSSDSCDIVLADSTLPEQAFELDVTEDAVTLIGADGEAKAVPALTIFRYGVSAFAVGPASGVWGELKEADATASEKDASSSAGADGASPSPGDSSGSEGREAAGGAALPGGADGDAGRSAPRDRIRHRGLFVCFCALAVLLATGVIVWLLWPQIASACPALETARRVTCGKVAGWSAAACRWTHELFVPPPPPPPPPPVPLTEIAAQHDLTLGSRNGRPLLTGNVRLRTERLAIRALAIAADPTVDFDLTDDETLRASATDLLFAVTEGDLFATAASNRVVTLAGYAPDAAHLETALRALNADVPGISRLVTTAIRVGGVRPKRAESSDCRRDPVAAVQSARSAPARSGGIPSFPPARAYAIAGILAKPYPCLVMRNGMRLVEGAQVDGAVVEKIEVDRLTLVEGKNRFVWKP